MLSPLNSLQHVQMSLLSRRWKAFCKSVPNIIFDHENFLENISHFYSSNFLSSVLRFGNFISDFLKNREHAVDIDTFIFKCNMYDYIIPTPISSIFYQAISYAIDHNTKNLHFYLHREDSYVKKPPCLFNSQSLEEAYLSIFDRNGKFVISPRVVNLPNLRKIHFTHISINKKNMLKFLEGTPILKFLILEKCVLRMNSIHFEKLESLSLDSCTFRTKNEDISFSISAPKLLFLSIDGDIPNILIFSNIPNLQTASIMSRQYSHACNFLNMVSHVSILEICFHYGLRNSINNTPNHPTFHNLKVLTFKYNCILCRLIRICNFLVHCPNLEELVLYHGNCTQDHVSYLSSFLCYYNYNFYLNFFNIKKTSII